MRIEGDVPSTQIIQEPTPTCNLECTAFISIATVNKIYVSNSYITYIDYIYYQIIIHLSFIKNIKETTMLIVFFL